MKNQHKYLTNKPIIHNILPINKSTIHNNSFIDSLTHSFTDQIQRTCSPVDECVVCFVSKNTICGVRRVNRKILIAAITHKTSWATHLVQTKQTLVIQNMTWQYLVTFAGKNQNHVLFLLKFKSFAANFIMKYIFCGLFVIG